MLIVEKKDLDYGFLFSFVTQNLKKSLVTFNFKDKNNRSKTNE
jgi:hypothetical protein